jgi:GAF domain-containing protein
MVNSEKRQTSGGELSPERSDRNLVAVLRLATEVCSSLSLQKTLDAACQAAVELFAADHSGLAILSNDLTHAIVQAEYPLEVGAVGRTIQIEHIPAEEGLVHHRQPIVIANVQEASDLGEVGLLLNELNIKSIVIVPIVGRDRTLGSFSLDSIGTSREFRPAEIELCQAFAALLAASIDNSNMFEGAETRAHHLGRLRDCVLSITSHLDGTDLITEAVRNAICLTESKGGGFYAYDAIRQELRSILVYPHSAERFDKVLKLGQGMAGRLLATSAPYLVTEDWSQSPYRADVFASMSQSFGAVLEVPIRWHDQPLGVLYVEDLKGRKFTVPQALLLSWFGDHVAVALVNSRVSTTQKNSLQLLVNATRLVAEAGELAKGLGQLSELIVRFMESSFCRILLLRKTEGLLQTRAAFPVPRSTAPLSWNPHLEESIPVSKWSPYGRTLELGKPMVLRWSAAGDRALIKEYSDALELDPYVQSLMLVPLLLDSQAMGLIEIAEMRNEQRLPITDEKRDLATVTAAQVTVLIDRLRWTELGQKRARLLEELDEKSRHLSPDVEIGQLLQQTLHLAAGLFPGTVGAIFQNHPLFERLELKYTEHVSQAPAAMQLTYSDPVLGEVARSGKLRVVESPTDWTTGSILLPSVAYKRIVVAPLIVSAEVRAILLLADTTGTRFQPEPDPDIDVLERFIARASAALSTARLIHAEPGLYRHMAVLQLISSLMLRTYNLDRTLKIFLTGVTSDYGLRFNRAAIVLANTAQSSIIGCMAIGEVEQSEAEAGWADCRTRFKDFRQFLLSIESGSLPPTTLELSIRQLRLPLKPEDAGLFLDCLRNPSERWLKVSATELHTLPPAFQQIFRATTDVLLVPLVSTSGPVGLLVADNKFTGAPFSEEDIHTLIGFARCTAVSIENCLHFERARAGSNWVPILRQTVNDMLTFQATESAAANVLENVRRMTEADEVSLIEINRAGQVLNRVVTGNSPAFDFDKLVRPHGISTSVMRSGVPWFSEDTSEDREHLNPETFRPEHRSSVCLPLVLHGKPIGTLWLHYLEQRRFTAEDISNLQFHADQAAASYGVTRLMELSARLQRIGASADAVADLADARKLIVQYARTMFQASACTLWPYDHQSGRFVPNALIAEGIPESALELFRDDEPRAGHTTYTTLTSGYLDVGDVNDPQYSFLAAGMRKTLSDVGVRSFQSVALRAEQTPLGVLYVSYDDVRDFTEEEKASVQNFALYAANILAKAAVVHQLVRARAAARRAARIAALGWNYSATLQLIAETAAESLASDPVVLFGYDDVDRRLLGPPATKGVTHSTVLDECIDVPSDHWIVPFLDSDAPTPVERVAMHPQYRDKRFARAENVQAFLAVPLRFGSRTVGLLFVNYRTARNFTEDLIADAKFIGDLAGVAIYNARLMQQLSNFTRELLAASSVDQVRILAVTWASKLMGAEFADMVICDSDNNLRIAASVGWNADQLRTLTLGKDVAGHSAYIMSLQKPVPVDDVDTETRFEIPVIIKQTGIASSVGVPLYHEGSMAGTITVYTRKRRQFGASDCDMLTFVAYQTAIALDRTRRYEELENKKDHLDGIGIALEAIAKSSRGLEAQKIYYQILRQAARILGNKLLLGTLLTYDAQHDHLTVEALYPDIQSTRLKTKLGERWSLAAGHLPDGRIGVCGRCVRKRSVQLVRDVLDDESDYIVFDERTRSEIAVPLIDNDVVVGVLNLESADPDAFSDTDLQSLTGLTTIPVIALQNAREFEKLRRAGRAAHARLQLAWLGLAANREWHTVQTHMATIRGAVTNILSDITPLLDVGAIPEIVAANLKEIDEISNEICNIAVTPPLSSESETTVVLVNELVRERLLQLWAKPAYQHAALEQRLELDPLAAVVISEAWLRCALDILLHNAAKELRSNEVPIERKRVEVVTKAARGGVEIVVTDFGRGVPPEVLDRLGNDLIVQAVREPSLGGTGMGLLVAQAIIDTYHGEFSCTTDRTGTSMTMWFPRVGK